jgi:hypothetical protein
MNTYEELYKQLYRQYAHKWMGEKMNTTEKIKVMQASLDGEEIEWASHGTEYWTLIYDCWDWVNYDYRVKPKVKEMTVSEIEQQLGYTIKVVK